VIKIEVKSLKFMQRWGWLSALLNAFMRGEWENIYTISGGVMVHFGEPTCKYIMRRRFFVKYFADFNSRKEQ
jgi:hypothetical protein